MLWCDTSGQLPSVEKWTTKRDGEKRLRLTGRALPMPDLVGRLLEAVTEFGDGAEQADDVTVVLIRRDPS
jgi:serine phosphatase RsbU (regulator of sigma subunit)